MSFNILGLGNKGEEYENTRHNTGRILVSLLAKNLFANDFTFDKKISALKTKISIAGKNQTLILPENFMNNSGFSIKPLIKKSKDIEKVIVIHDDLDLPFGTFRIAFNRGSGGHKGVLSVEKALKSRKFIRFRIGIAGTTPKGVTKKPHGEKKVINFIMAKFKEDEIKELKKFSKKIPEILETLQKGGLPKTMSLYNNMIW